MVAAGLLALAYRAARAVVALVVALLDWAPPCRATPAGFHRITSAAAAVVAPALRVETGLFNLAALASPVMCRERACGAAAEAGAEAALGLMASVSWLEALAVAVTAARHRSAQTEWRALAGEAAAAHILALT